MNLGSTDVQIGDVFHLWKEPYWRDLRHLRNEQSAVVDISRTAIKVQTQSYVLYIAGLMPCRVGDFRLSTYSCSHRYDIVSAFNLRGANLGISSFRYRAASGTTSRLWCSAVLRRSVI